MMSWGWGRRYGVTSRDAVDERGRREGEEEKEGVGRGERWKKRGRERAER